MELEFGWLFLAAVAYLGLLFLVAHATDSGWLPKRLINHPAVYTLSLGVYATSWSFYGSVGFAESQGLNFLTIYLGLTLAFVLAPLLLQPLLRLTREYQLSSLADVMAFRYRSQWVGVLVTLFMLAGSLPYIALQIRAVTESVNVLSGETAAPDPAFWFCVTLILFATLFGARHTSLREKHQGLVVAIAFESVIKLAALLAAALFAVFGVFGGPGALSEWLNEHPQALEALYTPAREGPWGTLLLLAFAAAFLLPRQFHMAFTENQREHDLSVASWGFPLFLLLLNVGIPPILWAGGSVAPVSMPADYYVLGITLHSGSTLLPTLVFIGGISAASAMVIVSTLALSAMCLNHLLLPARHPDPRVDLYRWLLWGRRVLIAVIILLSYGFYLLLEHNQGLVQLGLISFVAVAQFLPGVAGLLFWRRATRFGFAAGLLGGAGVWALTLLLPLLQESGLLATGFDLSSHLAPPLDDRWSFSTFWSLAVNGVLFVLGSLLTRPTADEKAAAHACCRETLGPPPGVVAARSPAEFQEQLALVLGPEPARHQIDQALADLGLRRGERRPGELGRLRERIERNLSGLVGPLLSHMIVSQRLAVDRTAEGTLPAQVHFVEQRLEASRTRLRGLAAELDTLRRYHRQVLQELPLGVVSVDADEQIVIWNLAMEVISGIDRGHAVGARLADLPAPWAALLGGFLRGADQHIHKRQIEVEEVTRWFNLHKAQVEDPAGNQPGRAVAAGAVLLIEDLTDLHMLEAELTHSERLASIGRLAAGVAHEIGNPVTGIACLAQNLQDEAPDPELLNESLKQVLEQTQRITDIVQSLVTFSHGGAPHGRPAAPVALRDCVEDAMRLVGLSERGRALHLRNECPEKLTIRGNHPRLCQVFVNLLNNACDASAPGQAVTIRAHADAQQVTVDVVDEGRGIPDHLRERVFEPFFTDKPPGKGTGLGLPLAYSIVHEYGGTIAILDGRESGARIRLQFPPCTGAAEREAS